MAKFVATDYKVQINGVDYSDNIAAVNMDISTDEVETTAFGESYRTRISGLKDSSVKIDFHQDFGAGSIDATFFPLLGTIGTVVVSPTSGTVSATNPTYTGTYVISAYSPFASSVGDLATLSITWPGAGAVTRGTAAA